MRLKRILGPAAVLVSTTALLAQTPPAGPTTGGSTPAPKSPGAGGKAPAPKSPGAGGTVPGKNPPLLQFPTDPGQTGSGSVAVRFPTNLFQTPEVARSLTLTERQLAQLNAATEQVRNRFQPQFNDLSTVPIGERAARAAQLNRDFMAAWLAQADDVLNAQQLARYQQLQLQFDAFAAMSDPEIQRRLALTQAQTGVLPNALGWSDLQTQAILRQAELDRARGTQLYSDYVRAYQERLNQFLTAEQMRIWREMTGDPFQFPPPFPAATTPGTGPKGPTTGGPVQPGGPTTGGPTTGGPTPPKK